MYAKHKTGPEMREFFPPGLTAAGTGQIPLRMRTPAFSSLLLARAIAGRPDLIISTHLNFAPIAMWLKRTGSLKYCVALHGIDAWKLRRPSQGSALRCADLLLPVSRFTQETVANAQQLPANRFRMLPNTIDSEQFTIGPKPSYLLERHQLSANHHVVLSVGRLDASEQYKGQDRVMRALRGVQRNIPDVRYLIVGDGNDRERLATLARTEGVADAVIFAGRVGSEELPDYYRLCDLFALPSTGEGFGIVFLEALACGRPVLAGDRDGARDPLVNGELGVLVDPEDVLKLSQTISMILSRQYPHPLLYRPEELRSAMLERFSFERFTAEVGEILSTLNGLPR